MNSTTRFLEESTKRACLEGSLGGVLDQFLIQWGNHKTTVLLRLQRG